MRHIALALAVVLAGGCITSSYQPSRYYTLTPVVHVEMREQGAASLGVRPIEPAQPYKKRQMVYRERAYALGFEPHDEWAEAPSDFVTRELLDAIAATGRFQDVGYAHDMAAPDFIITGQLRKFDQVRSSDAWTASCEIRLALREGAEQTLVWSHVFSAQEPLSEKSPSAFAAAMSQALARIIEDAAGQIADIPTP